MSFSAVFGVATGKALSYKCCRCLLGDLETWRLGDSETWRLGDLETFRRACFNNTKLFELFDVVRAKYKSSNDRA
jgi:hypothetical protein